MKEKSWANVIMNELEDIIRYLNSYLHVIKYALQTCEFPFLSSVIGMSTSLPLRIETIHLLVKTNYNLNT